MNRKYCGAGLPNADGDEPWFWCTLAAHHKGQHTDGERTWGDRDVVEVTVTTEVWPVMEHRHDFVGDQDTCVGLHGCPLTWGDFKRMVDGLNG